VEGLLAARRGVGGRAYFLAHPSRFPGASWAPPPRIIMARRPRVGSRPPLVAYAVGLGAEAWSHITRRPGIISREEGGRGALPLVDLRYPARRRRTGVRGADAAGLPASPKPSPGTRRRLADVLRNGTPLLGRRQAVHGLRSSFPPSWSWAGGTRYPTLPVYSPCTWLAPRCWSSR